MFLLPMLKPRSGCLGDCGCPETVVYHEQYMCCKCDRGGGDSNLKVVRSLYDGGQTESGNNMYFYFQYHFQVSEPPGLFWCCLAVRTVQV